MLGRGSFRRKTRSRAFRATTLVLAVVLAFDVLSLLSSRSDFQSRARPLPDVRSQKIFIASLHWNNAAILRSNWNRAVLDLAEYFGVHNVHISVYESGSWDESKEALRALDNDLEDLGVKRTITLDETTHADELRRPVTHGWVETPRGRKELRRIPYLSKLRNLSLQPLQELAAGGIKFDKVLFLNDVVFNTEDVARLLATRNGDYAAACSLDFAKPPNYYDTFALRDSDGHEAISNVFPYFRSTASRTAMLTSQPVPVQSCWNGIVAFDVAPFYAAERLEFRGVSDDLALQHVEASECCLIHADNPLSSKRGIWLNPDVRVGYSPEAYAAVHSSSPWPGLVLQLYGIWTNRVRRWLSTPALKKAAINKRLSLWANGRSNVSEPGDYCLINEMQVLVENGWAHV